MAAPKLKGATMARKTTLTLCARVSEQTDNLRSELQQRLDVPLHNLIELGFRALKSQLDEQCQVMERTT
jgi:hypothetical protein